MDVRGLGAALVDLVLPAGCAGCGHPVHPWCPGCRGQLGPSTGPHLPGGPGVLAVGPYTGPLRSALLRYKERGRRDLAAPLAALLAAALDEALGPPPWPAPVWLVPAPSRQAAARARGGDHVDRLCRAVAARRPGVRVARALRLSRGTRDSVGLDAAQRAANLTGRVRLRRAAFPGASGAAFPGASGAAFPGASGVVLLVDDVVTTGATLRACRDVLAGAGVAVGGALVLCDATAGRT